MMSRGPQDPDPQSRKRLRCRNARTAAVALLLTATLGGCVHAPDPTRTMSTIADARFAPATLIDNGEPGDSPGDLIVFDQPLLDIDGLPIGNNSGVCIRTLAAQFHQCQWTLTLDDGSIQVAGREAERGRSAIAIVGGTGAYRNIRGEMLSTNNGDGTFTQILHFTTD